ncbi:MAG TPA: hypothetical protein VN622_00690 [Clostridia bacterium]|nr:hypothetical protein [Clostridia bacterium]
MRELLRSAVAPLSNWRLDAIHLVGNALLMAAASFWLLIPEAHAWQLAFALISGLLIVFVFAWLHCGTLAHGVTPIRDSIKDDFRRGLRHIPLFLVLFAVLLLLMNYAQQLSDNTWRYSGYWFTLLPKFMQSWIGFARFNSWVEFKLAALTWFVLPALFLPLLSAAASFGLRRSAFGNALRTYIRWKYWVGIAIAAALGIWLPSILVNWKPMHGLTKETVSFVTRLFIAYVLAVMTWIMASALVGNFLRDAAGGNVGGNAAS